MIPLKNVLLINGASSGVTAIGLIALPNSMADLFEIAYSSVFIGVGIFLLAFATFVLVEAGKLQINANRVRMIIALDVIWVLASLFTVTMTLTNVSAIGHVLIIAVAAWVAAMVFLQAKGLKKITA